MKEYQKPLDEKELVEKLQTMAGFLEDQKALEPFVHYFGSSNSLWDGMIVVSATSSRHAQGIADGLLRGCQQAGYEFLHMEGYDAGQWILIDCNDIVVHIFLEEARNLYRLEDLCKVRSQEQGVKK